MYTKTQKELLKISRRRFLKVEITDRLRCLCRTTKQPVDNYLLAAEAFQQRGDDIVSIKYFERAAKVSDNNQLPVDIIPVSVQLVEANIHAARQGVNKLLDQAATQHHPKFLRMAKQGQSELRRLLKFC
ncbi:MAG: hypothetical protein ACEY3J_04605 [Arsenophonus sp.]